MFHPSIRSTRKSSLLLSSALCATLALPAMAQDDARDQPSDATLAVVIESELHEEPGVAGYLVDAHAADGIVTLTGTVDSLLAKDRAVRIARTIRGVEAVIDTLEVRTPTRPDEEVRSDIVSALAANPATDSWEVDVSSSAQHVTLTGTVDSWQEKELAERIAKGVRGVRDVRSDIDVEYRLERTDREILTDVQEALRWDTRVDHGLIDVEVTDEHVKLAGTVGSAAEKERARRKAWVAGVDSVDTSGLDVSYWARDEQLRRDKYLPVADADVAEAIDDALLFDPRVLSTNVRVEVDDGVATLSGKVSDLAAKRAAADDARNTVGVWKVRNRVKVRTDEPQTDAELLSAVTAAIDRDPYVSQYDVLVSVRNGRVTLSGAVDSHFEKAQADLAAAGIEGVTNVNNNLVVTDAHVVLTHDPHVDTDWYVYDYDWYTYPVYTPTASDAEILDEIEDELWWSPFVDEDKVAVSVENGVATLTGTLETWGDVTAAVRNAYEGGAVLVDNDLVVDLPTVSDG